MLVLGDLRPGLRFRYYGYRGARNLQIVAFARFASPKERPSFFLGPHPMAWCGLHYAAFAACKAAWGRKTLIPIGCVLGAGREIP